MCGCGKHLNGKPEIMHGKRYKERIRNSPRNLYKNGIMD